MSNIEKLMELVNKKNDAAMLVDEIQNPLILEYYDFESDKDIDKKIAVLKQVKAGKPFSEIDGFWDILELYPDEDVVI